MEDEAQMHTMRTPDSIANAFDALEVARRRGVTRRDDLYEELYRRQCIGWARREDERRSSWGGYC